MKYTCSVEVPVSRSKCIELWFDVSKMNRWQDGFKHKTWLEGEPNAVGSIADILLSQQGRKLELRERIISNQLPDFIEGEYVHEHMTNTQKVIFEELDASTTRVITEVDYTQFNKLIVKIMAMIFPSMFRKQSQKWLDQFKEMASVESRLQ